MERTLENKNVIITGSNRGIGKSTVKKLAQNGANIWACARKQNTEFENYLSDIAKTNNVHISPVYFDLADENSVKEKIHNIVLQKKVIDILINNAGVAYGGLMQMTPLTKLRETFEINFFSQILMMQLVSKAMIRQKSGCIINIASAGGIETNPGYLAYGSSKAAVIWATQSVAKELGQFGIRVNAIAPGLTETEMGFYKSENERIKTIERTALRRMAKPEEIADAIVYLASDNSSFVTGQILRVDGGRI